MLKTLRAEERVKKLEPNRNPNLILKKAEGVKEIEAALKLRFEVFNLELMEGIASSYLTGMDRDEYDDFCDHLIVVDQAQDLVVGTYRLLPGRRAEKGPGYYSEKEFEMSALKEAGGEKLELGRACVHRDYRDSWVLNLMWTGIALYIDHYNINHVFGCGSIHTTDSLAVSSIYAYLKDKYLVEERFRVTPRKEIPGFNPRAAVDEFTVLQELSPLLSAYLRLGAQIGGEPALDEEFRVADFFILLHREKLLDRYQRRYFPSRHEIIF